MSVAWPAPAGVVESERYVLLVDGAERGAEPVGRAQALAWALGVVAAGDAHEVVIVDARTYEVRVCWWRQRLCWAVRDVAGWLCQPEGGRHVC